MKNINANNSEDKIDLLELFKVVWIEKKMITRFVIIFGLIGLFIALFSEKKYTASVTVIPQTSSNSIGGDLGGLAAIAGINIGGQNKRGIPASLYPKIVQSVPFKKKLLSVSLKFLNVKEEITYREYYEEHKKRNVLSLIKSYTIGLPNKIFGLFKRKSSNKKIRVEVKNDSIYRISEEESVLFKQLEGQLGVEINKKEGFIKISFSMPEALPSAQMAKKVQELLQKAIINFKTQKAEDEFTFIEERYKELKKDFKKKQAILASFRDGNQRLITSRSKSRLESFQSEYNLAYNVYSELAKQLETQKIKLKENTPVFTVIEPVSVPISKSKPRRLIILSVWVFFGLISGTGFVLGKRWINELKKEW